MEIIEEVKVLNKNQIERLNKIYNIDPERVEEVIDELEKEINKVYNPIMIVGEVVYGRDIPLTTKFKEIGRKFQIMQDSNYELIKNSYDPLYVTDYYEGFSDNGKFSTYKDGCVKELIKGSGIWYDLKLRNTLKVRKLVSWGNNIGINVKVIE